MWTLIGIFQSFVCVLGAGRKFLSSKKPSVHTTLLQIKVNEQWFFSEKESSIQEASLRIIVMEHGENLMSLFFSFETKWELCFF